jgi:hypothetical protein
MTNVSGLGRWLRGFATTCIIAFGAFVAYHVLRFYVGLGWAVVIAALVALLVVIAMAVRIVWVAGMSASRDEADTT